MEEEKVVRIRLGKFVGWAILIIVAGWMLSKIKGTLILFLFSLCFTYLLYPAVKAVSNFEIPFLKRKPSWFVSISIVYLILGALIVAGGIMLIPSVSDQVEHIIRELPGMVTSAQNTIIQIQEQYNRYDIPDEVKERVSESLTGIAAQTGVYLESQFKVFGNFLLHFFSWIVFIIIALISAFFILMEVDGLMLNAYSYIPPSYQKRVTALFHEINDIFGNYIRGTIICVFSNGILTYFMLFIAILPFQLFFPGLASSFPFYKYALVASVLAGVLFPIPYIAHAISIFVGSILAFLQTQSITYSIYIGLVIFAAFQVVDFVVRPKIMGDALGVSTIFVFFAAIAGGELFGAIGLLLGIPLAVMLISIVRFVYDNFLSFPVGDDVKTKYSKASKPTDPGNPEEPRLPATGS